MNTESKYIYSSKSLPQSLALGQKLAKLANTPLLIELVGDLGGGKTTLVKGIAQGLGIKNTVTSPTFNIHRGYQAPRGIRLEHFDLYRLSDDEIVINELQELLDEPGAIVCVEWADHFNTLSAPNRLIIKCAFLSDNERLYQITARGSKAQHIITELKK